jgi:hypothetical protein
MIELALISPPFISYCFTLVISPAPLTEEDTTLLLLLLFCLVAEEDNTRFVVGGFTGFLHLSPFRISVR